MKHIRLILACLVFASLTQFSTAYGQRPTAPKLFSQKALLYARVDDTRDLKTRLATTSMGRLSEDPELKPILKTFYSTFTSSIQGMQDAIGVNLDELLSIPNGELAFALIPTKAEPAVCVLIEAGDELPAVQLMLDKLEQRVVESGSTKEKKEIGNIEVIKYMNANSDRQIGYFIDSGVLVACNKPDYAETLALIWTGNGIDHKSLADNRDFTTILSRCVGTAGERPQVSFFIDPIAMFRELGKSNNGTTIALAAMKQLGISGIKAVGGSAIIAPNEDFDQIVHAHLLLDTNRQGVMRAVRPKSGSTNPQAWVPEQVNSYSTINWDFAKTIKAISEIVDTFGGENAFENQFIVNANKNLGIDIRKDFFELLDDRFTLVQVVIPPKRINSQANLYSLHIKDPTRMKTEVLPKFFEKLKSNKGPVEWKSELIGDTTVYFMEIPSDNRNIRVPQPCFGVLGSELLFSDAVAAFRVAIETNSSGDKLLEDSIEFKLVRDRIKAQLKDVEFSILSYQRPDESLRLFYDLASDPENITNLEQMATNNPFFTALVTALRSKKLPPFEVIAKYLAPGGAFVVEEETGLHYTGFSMRRE